MKIQVGYFVRYRKGTREGIGEVTETHGGGPRKTHYLNVVDTRKGDKVTLRVDQVKSIRKKL